MNKDNFRKQVLKVHYDLANGRLLTPVMRTDVADKLDIDHYNNPDLIDAITYLGSKGLLKSSTNMEDELTDLGVDLVESPDFMPADKTIDQQTLDALIELLSKINNTLERSRKGLLEAKTLEETRDSIKRSLLETIGGIDDEEVALMYKKVTGGWTNALKPGFVTEQGAINILEPYQKLISDIYEHLTGTVPKADAYISTGESYEGRKMLRMAISGATKEIAIQDNYMHPDMLAVLESYVISNPNLQIRLLMKKSNNSHYKGFVSDLRAFENQYPNVKLEVKDNDKCHGRFIFTDNISAYQSGHSFLDLGNKADRISKINDSTIIQKALNDFNNWWITGSPA